MKTLIDKSLNAFIGMIAFAAVLLLAPQRASAQYRAGIYDREIPVTEFTGVNVANDFEVTVTRGSYGVHLSVDEELAPYVEIYVKARVLNISYDEKSVPKDLRKLYKGRNGLVPTFRVVVYTPELSSVTLWDNVTLTGTDEFATSDFELIMTDHSLVNNLTVKASSAKLSLKKNAQATLNLKTDRGVEAETGNNANLKFSYTGGDLTLTAEGSSIISADGGPCSAMNLYASNSAELNVSSEAKNVELTAEGSSRVTLTGKATEMKVTGSRNATVDAFSMPVEKVDADLAGNSYVTVNVSKKVSATLVGGSALYFSGTPEFQIGKIVKSTLAPYGTK